MSNTLQSLKGSIRENAGKIACKKIRNPKTNEIPAVVYGEGKPNVLISVPEKEVNLLNSRKRLNGHLFELLIDGKKTPVLVKDIQTHFLKKTVNHIDFQRISKTHKITTTVPILFLHADESPAIKQKGQITYATTELKIHCLPANLPEHIELNLSNLELDQIIHLSELKMPKGVELAEVLDDEHNPTLLTAHLPKVIQESESPVDGTTETDVEEDSEEPADSE